MELVIDANILMSALIATEGKTYDLIFNDKIRLYAPEYLLEEIEKYKKDILAKSKLSESEFKLFFSLIATEIKLTDYLEFKKFIPKAKDITPDPDDTEYFALALKLGCTIWSNDKKLKEQDKVKVYSTKEIFNMFKNEREE